MVTRVSPPSPLVVPLNHISQHGYSIKMARVTELTLLRVSIPSCVKRGELERRSTDANAECLSVSKQRDASTGGPFKEKRPRRESQPATISCSPRHFDKSNEPTVETNTHGVRLASI